MTKLKSIVDKSRDSDLYFNCGYLKGFKGVSSVKDVKPENVIHGVVEKIKKYKNVIKVLNCSQQDLTEQTWDAMHIEIEKYYKKHHKYPTLDNIDITIHK